MECGICVTGGLGGGSRCEISFLLWDYWGRGAFPEFSLVTLLWFFGALGSPVDFAAGIPLLYQRCSL
jgi:hypothetical protein